MAHIAPPTIPVKQNKRTTEKPISMLNGDYLPQLKTLKSSEMGPSVLGHNASIQHQTKKLLRQWYNEQQHQVDKLRNSQRLLYRQLARIHLERRQLQRSMLTYRQVEARNEFDRERQRLVREKELLKISQEIEKAQQEKGRKKDKPLTPRPAEPETQVHVITDFITVNAKVVEAPKMKPRLSNESLTKFPAITDFEDKASGAVKEIEPLTRVKSKSFIKQSSAVLKDIPEDHEISASPDFKFGADKQINNFIQTGNTKLLKIQLTEHNNNNNNINSQSTPIKTVTVTESLKRKKKVNNSEDISQSSDELKTTKVLSQVEKNRLRAKKREIESRKLLKEPFSYYRLTSNGDVIEVPNAPPKFNTAEPSNREAYESKKRLEAEKATYLECMNRLSKYTAFIMNEDIKLAAAFEKPKVVEKPREEMKELKVGGQEWMKVFLRNDIPDDVDPASMEAMQFARYLRESADDENIDPETLFH